MQEPSESNNFLFTHTELLRFSFHHWLGRHLLDFSLDAQHAARELYFAKFALMSHNTAQDPIFNYDNECALNLFETTWDEFTAMPSRLSAEPLNREERRRLLETVAEKGYIDDYCGVRVSCRGKRFQVDNAIVWNIIDPQGKYYGQAACLLHLC